MEILIFTGPQQTKLPTELVQSAQKFGPRVKWIQMKRPGSNALDFHIAFKLGELSKENPKAYFHIVSKDSGFDSLLDFIKSQNISADRVNSVEDIPLLRKISEIRKNPEEFVVKHLFAAPPPKRLKRLQNAIKTWLNADDHAAEKIISSLKARKILTVDENGRIVYPQTKKFAPKI